MRIYHIQYYFYPQVNIKPIREFSRVKNCSENIKNLYLNF